MRRLKVLVIFGGCSSEYGVSLESAYAVIKNLDREKYEPVLAGISKTGDWYYFSGDIERIPADTWNNEEDCVPAALSPNRSERGLLIRYPEGDKLLVIDAAFPVLHGKNGEDGTVQGAIALAGIPLAGCGVMASALCMDKDRAHRLAAAVCGVRVPKAIVLKNVPNEKKIYDFAEDTGYPLYVKPVKAGSSYGVTKVTEESDLLRAVQDAFLYDDEVILEENIEGFEVGCAVLGTDKLITGEADEIELSSGFFDFTEKYTLKTSAIHVPARIPEDTSARVKDMAKQIYLSLGCAGFARVDMFLTPSGELVFNEVNTIPGFTEHSRYPGMMKAAGYSFSDILDKIIRQAVKK